MDGSLRIPEGVTLCGAGRGLQFAQGTAPADLKGTVIMAYGGRGDEEAPALFELGNAATVAGLSVYYPEQTIDNVQPYPWTFHLQGFNHGLATITLFNSYNGIRIGPEGNGRHTIRDVHGTVLRRGLSVDMCCDIGRVDNVHWHCHWWESLMTYESRLSPVFDYMSEHCEAFIIARTDWQRMNNTFVYPCNIGYHFTEFECGPGCGQYVGIGADVARTAIKVDAISFAGLCITNSEFVATYGDDPMVIYVGEGCLGPVQFLNCSGWGRFKRFLVSHSPHAVSLNQFNIVARGKNSLGNTLINADNGKLTVKGVSFSRLPFSWETEDPATDPPPPNFVHLAKGVRYAVIKENAAEGGVRIINDIGSRAVIADNEPTDESTV